MPWFKLTLDERALSKRADLCLEREFNAVLAELEANRCLAMYRDSQYQNTFYVGCDTVCQLLHGLIQFYQGEPCQKPELSGLLEVTGHFDDHQIDQVL
ncbi:hypothetical protein [Litoribrevibacter albus]|uniref:Uncharacterized protein n=1 Tax=Litoribrevibacter albus TaxID=1473156 RepID=A0AA37S8H5_9GAMM|nr:hypothetical protein [Litoribrevibacter albus]GLQ31020.1 hypothetical protein GCM10007876_14990 [Litoribrevibacter albus]